MQPQELIEEAWDIKRIIIGIVSVVVVGAGGFAATSYVRNHQLGNLITQENPTKTVKGAETKENPSSQQLSDNSSFSLPSKNDVEQKLEEVKKQVSNLSLSEIASSSPQVQKVLQDLKALEEFPHNQAKDMCLKVCNSF